jgi:hypothetical protein
MSYGIVSKEENLETIWRLSIGDTFCKLLHVIFMAYQVVIKKQCYDVSKDVRTKTPIMVPFVIKAWDKFSW